MSQDGNDENERPEPGLFESEDPAATRDSEPDPRLPTPAVPSSPGGEAAGWVAQHVPRPSFFPEESPEQSSSFADALIPSLRPPPAQKPHAFSQDSGLYTTHGMRTTGEDEGSDEVSSVVLLHVRDELETAAPAPESMGPSLRPRLISALLASAERSSAVRLDSAEQSDQGALAALRTLPWRKRRLMPLPLVGTGADVEGSRVQLLHHLADRASGGARARLLVAVAELHARRGEAAEGQAAHANAYEADPQDVLALRRHLRDCLLERNVQRACKLLRELCALGISSAERALAVCALAELAPSAAGDVLDEARRLYPSSLIAGLLHAELCWKSGRKREAAESLRRSAELWEAPAVRATLLLLAAQLFEQQADPGQALLLYAHASAANPGSHAAALGAYRSCRATHELQGATHALGSLVELERDAMLRAELTRRRAQLLHEGREQPEAALQLLHDASSVLALRERARAAEAAGDDPQHLDALSKWADAAGGGERGLALVEIGRFHAGRDERELAERALRDAALAGAPRGLLGLLRETLARAAGDAAGLALAAEDEDGDSVLRAAAKLAGESTQTARELQLLVRATAGQDNPLSAEVLSLDAACELPDLEYLQAGLRRAAERLSPELRVGPQLALLDLVEEPAALSSLLDDMRTCAQGQALTLRSIAARTPDPEQSAQLWLEEAAHTDGTRAAFAASMAGRLLEDAGLDPVDAYIEALDAVRGYAPACYALEAEVRRQGDLLALERVHRELAATTQSCDERAARRVRLALLASDSDAAAATRWLDQASDDHPGDVLLSDLGLRLSAQSAPAELAARMRAAAALDLTPSFSRALHARATSTYEDAGLWDEALRGYEAMLERNPSDGLAKAGLLPALRQTHAHDRLLAAAETQLMAAHTLATRLFALQTVAEIELGHGEHERARAAFETMVESDAGHVRALRGLERLAWDDGDLARELVVASRFAECLSDDAERAAQLRMAVRADALLEAGDKDALLTQAGAFVRRDLACALQLEALALRTDDRTRFYDAASSVADLLQAPFERASYALRAAEAFEAAAPARAASDLAPALQGAPEHPLAAEELGRLYRAAGNPRAAAETFLRAAANATQSPRRQARMLHAAGVIFHDELMDREQALAAFSHVVELDVLYADAFARMRVLLEASGDTQARLELLARRLAAPADPSFVADLHEERARLWLTLGDSRAAREALDAALTADPVRPAALRTLAGLHMQAGAHREAAEVLVTIARVTTEPEALAHAFYELGLLYDGVLADPRRAEIAFTRVVALAPDDPRPVERLVALWLRQGSHDRALRALQHLVATTADEAQRERYVIELAQARLDTGDARLAEQTLEEARRARPASAPVLMALAELYTKQHDKSALAMHLVRSCQALRGAIEGAPGELPSWLTLIDILRTREREDGVALVENAAHAFGLQAPQLVQRPIRGLGDAVLGAGVIRKLVPRGMSDAPRALLQAAPQVLASFMPAEIAADATPFESSSRAVLAVAELFGEPRIVLLGTRLAVCIPVADQPLTVLVHRETFEHASEASRFFLIARAVAVAKRGLTLLVRASPERLLLVVHALKRCFDARHSVAAIDMDELARITKQLETALSPHERSAIETLLIDLFADGEWNPRRAASAAQDFGARIALAASGECAPAVDALLWLRGKNPSDTGRQARTELAKLDGQLRALLSFAVSEAYLEARRELLAQPPARSSR